MGTSNRRINKSDENFTELDKIIKCWEMEEKRRERKQNATSATRKLITVCKFLKYMRTNHPNEYWWLVTGLWSFSLDNTIHHNGEDYYKFHNDVWNGLSDIVSVEKINNVKL